MQDWWVVITNYLEMVVQEWWGVMMSAQAGHWEVVVQELLGVVMSADHHWELVVQDWEYPPKPV